MKNNHISVDGHKDLISVKISEVRFVLAGLFLIVFLFLVGGGWALYANLAGAVIASGQVVIAGKSKTIQHLDGGIVAEIHVDDGQHVKEGDILIRLDDTLLKANLNIYQNRFRESVARRDRLVAERDDAGSVVWNDNILQVLGVDVLPTIKQGQEKLFEVRRATKQGQASQLQERIEQFENQKQGIKALMASKLAQLQFLDEERNALRSLKEKGLIPNSRFLALERQREEFIGQNAEYDSELARIQNSIGETEIQIFQIDREFRQSVLSELRQAEQEVNDITHQLYATKEQLKRVEICAPVSGIVHELAVFTIGGVVSAGASIMQIIPQNEKFEVEASVEPHFIDELYPGQPATLRFSAFNQRTTPELEGVIKSISAHVVVNKQTGFSSYMARISVTEKELVRIGDDLPLIPGMPVEVFVKTRERTPLNYLIKPLLDQISRAFREE